MLSGKVMHLQKKISKTTKVNAILFIILKLYFTFSFLNIEYNCREIILGYSYITLKINVSGYSKILSDNFGHFPDEIFINNNSISDTNTNEYYFNNYNNNIKLVWHNEPTTMSSMFKNCLNITEIDLSNFYSSEVVDMSSLFYGCSNLSSLNLSNLDTSQVLEMNSMFYECSSLISLDLSNFETTQVVDMNSMFSGCSSLIYLDLSKFSFKTQFTNNIFKGCQNLEFINLQNSEIENSNIINEITSNLNSENLIICDNEIEFNNTFSQKISINCMNKTIEDDNMNKCFTNKISLNNKYSCEICGLNFHQKFNDSYNTDSNINCYESKSIYCPFKFYYNLTSNIFYCTENEKCPNDYNKLIIEKNQCIDKCERDSIYKYELENICYDLYNYELIIKEKSNNEIINKTEIINNVITDLFREFNKRDIDNGTDNKKVVNEDITVILTSTLNQKNNEHINNISMDLGQCENILKYNYNISNNDSLYILQIVSEEDGMKIPKIEYEIFYPLNNGTNLTKLNLSYCKGTKIEISIKVKINDNIDKYNLSSDYYNDICSKATSENGTDILLKDRRNEFVDNNMSLCEENCDLINYDFNTEKAKCSCDIKLNIPSNYDIKFNKKEFLKSFIDFKNIFNFNIMKCYKTVFRIKSLLKNYGFFILFLIIILYFITLFLFLNISYDEIKKEIKDIILSLNYYDTSIIIRHRIKKKVKIKKKTKHLKTKEIKNKNKKNFKKINSIKKQKEKDQSYIIQITNNFDNSISSKKINQINNEITAINYASNINILKYKDFELNSLDYEEALQLDHRNYCDYYTSLLKYNHPIMYSFAPYNDYNSKIIKMFLFFFSFALDFTVNAIFFSDDTMHKIYEDKGKFDFLYQVPQIIYSTIISKFIDTLIRKFALTQDNIVDLKKEKGSKKFKKINLIILRTLKIKFILFFCLAFMILSFFWYYITCFCGIYINTQIHLIKDSLSSLVLSLIIPFALYLIPGIFRLAALKEKKKKNSQKQKKYIYDFSIFLENILG